MRKIYFDFLSENHDAFLHREYTVAYHALSAALYCALQLHDVHIVEEVDHLAQEQAQELGAQFAAHESPVEPTELSLYRSLAHTAHARRALLQEDSFATADLFPHAWSERLRS